MASTLVYTSDARHDAIRAARAERVERAQLARVARAEREFARRFPRVLAMVREEGEWFNVKVCSTTADYRGQGWSADSVARLILDPESSVEYWPTPE